MKDSKYYIKTHEEVTYNLDDIECPYCHKWFCADYDFFKYEEKEEGTFAKIFCPYCGKRHGRCI